MIVLQLLIVILLLKEAMLNTERSASNAPKLDHNTNLESYSPRLARVGRLGLVAAALIGLASCIDESAQQVRIDTPYEAGTELRVNYTYGRLSEINLGLFKPGEYQVLLVHQPREDSRSTPTAPIEVTADSSAAKVLVHETVPVTLKPTKLRYSEELFKDLKSSARGEFLLILNETAPHKVEPKAESTQQSAPETDISQSKAVLDPIIKPLSIFRL
jgi:hypothetical protein